MLRKRSAIEVAEQSLASDLLREMKRKTKPVCGAGAWCVRKPEGILIINRIVSLCNFFFRNGKVVSES